MKFNNMVDTSQGTACGGYTYELEYMSTGPLYKGSAPDLSLYSITADPAIKGTISTKEWVGTHPMRLKCTNGVYDTLSTARGINGFFNSVYTEITVKIVQPC